LKPKESKKIQVKLKISKSLPKKKSGGYKELVQIKSEFFEKRFQVSYFPAAGLAGSDGKENREVSNTAISGSARPTLPTASAAHRSSHGGAQMEGGRSESPDSLDVEPACGIGKSILANEEKLDYQSQLSQLRAQHEFDLQARDFQIASLKARVERCCAEIDEWKRVASEGEQFKIRAQELTEQNRELTSRMEDRDEKVASFERESKHLERLRQEIYSAVPDLQGIVEMVTAREREEREERDKKVLRILKSKDQKVAELHGENTGLSRLVAQLRQQLEHVEASNNELSRELEASLRTREETIRQLGADLNAERERNASFRRTMDEMRKDTGELSLLKRQISELLKQAEESEKIRVRLESDVEDLLRERTEREGKLALWEEKEREWKGQDRKIASMQRQLQEQADQIDCLVAELSSRSQGEVHATSAAVMNVLGSRRSVESEDVEELREQVFIRAVIFLVFNRFLDLLF
jgi:chromosome segregation ATPase